MMIQVGQLVTTPGARADFTNDFMEQCLARHMTGDFGDLDEEDLETNRRAVSSNGRLLSAYKKGEKTLWVITEAGGQVTTFLLPSEY